MGEVYRGRDLELGRELAVKVLRAGHGGRPELERRFLEEAQVCSQLQHPGVVPVHAIGRLADGRPFFTMKLVQGRTLAELLAGRNDPSEDLARFLGVFEQVCQAVAYAHSRGVLHRDLKPANVMVGEFGEVQVMDWGLAKVLQPASPVAFAPGEVSPVAFAPRDLGALTRPRSPGLTESGAVLGTPAYMAPEQARGEVVDERADVFGLGAILCEVLTGRPPYGEQTRDEVFRQASRGDLADAHVRLEAIGADAELVGLARDCLAPERERRPRDAGAVARAVTAYRASVQERLRAAELERAAAQARAKEERRRQRLGLALAGSLLLTLGLAAGGGWWYQRAEAHKQAERARLAAVTERDVTAALGKAEALGQQAWEVRDDPAQWQALLFAALSAAERAEGLLHSGVASDELRERVSTVRAELEEADAGRRLVARLEEIRLEKADSSDGSFRKKRVAPLYRTAFPEHGLDVLGPGPGEVARRLRAHPLREPLLTALDDWAQMTPEKAERERLVQVLQAADPDGWRQRWRTALVTKDREALKKLAAEAQAGSLSPAALMLRARAWARAGAAKEAEHLLREGLKRFPADFWLNHELAYTLCHAQPPRLGEAIEYYRAARALRSRSPAVHLNLGLALSERGRVDEAIACYREALHLAPDYAKAHNNLGAALKAQGRLDDAITCYQKALRLDPDYAKAHYNLGNARYDQKDLAGAVACYQEALRLDPDYARAHNNLGNALEAQGRVDEAVASYRETVRLEPKQALPRYHLGLALQQLGRFAEAIAAFRRGEELSKPTAPFLPELRRGIQQCQVALDYDGLLPAVLRGEASPATAADGINLAWLCQQPYKQCYAASARLYRGAFAAGPQLATDLGKARRYNAACAAALAGCGQGKDAAGLDTKGRAAWRRQALAWLRADLAARDKLAPRNKAAVRQTMLHWRQDSDFAGVRDKEMLDRLPEAERAAWQKLWADVDALLRRVTELSWKP
jgi:serine/threonine-protein kinase